MKRCLVGASVLASLVMFALGSGYGSASTSGRWLVTDVGALASRVYPDFSYVTFAGMTADERIFWTGDRGGATSVRDLFEWQQGTITDLGPLPMHPSVLSDQGALAGTDFSAPFGPGPGYQPPPVHGFLWQSGQVTSLGTFGSYASVDAINDRGQIVIDYYPATGPMRMRAGVWQAGKLIDLGTLGGTWSSADAINERGQIVGGSQTRNGGYHAYLWQKGTMTDLGTLSGDTSEAMAINDQGQIVGRYGNRHANSLGRAFVWQHGKAADLGRLSSDRNLPLSINNHGQVIRTRDGGLGSTRGLLWQQGKTINLGSLGGQQTYPLAINERGEIVGTAALPGGTVNTPKLRAFLWQHGTMIQLPGAVLYYASSMTIDPPGTHIALGTCCPSQLLLWTYRG